MLHLSDAFKFKGEENQLELDVYIININNGKNESLMRGCKILKEYAHFVEQVRLFVEREGEVGFGNAIRYCIERDILKYYLKERFKVVENMLTAEYNYEMDIALQRSEKYKLAYAQGEARGASIKQRDIALNLLAMKQLSIAQIAKVTGFSIKEVEALTSELKQK